MVGDARSGVVPKREREREREREARERGERERERGRERRERNTKLRALRPRRRQRRSLHSRSSGATPPLELHLRCWEGEHQSAQRRCKKRHSIRSLHPSCRLGDGGRTVVSETRSRRAQTAGAKGGGLFSIFFSGRHGAAPSIAFPIIPLVAREAEITGYEPLEGETTGYEPSGRAGDSVARQKHPTSNPLNLIPGTINHI